MAIKAASNVERKVTVDDHPAATLDQMSGAIGYVRREYGDYRYRVAYHGSDMFVIVHPDMKWDDPVRFFVDYYGNVYTP